MALYRYRAVNKAGEALEGTVESADDRTAIRSVQAMGYFPVSVELAQRNRRTSILSVSSLKLTRSRTQDRDDALDILKKLADLTNAGLTVDRSLEVLSQMVSAKEARATIVDIREQVRSGAVLADAMTSHPRFFPDYICGAIRAAEQGGFLPGALSQLADSQEQLAKLRREAQSAFIYPAILLLMAGMSIVLVLTVVIPGLAPLFASAGDKLSISARLLIAASSLVTAHGSLLLLGIIIVLFASRAALVAPAMRRSLNKGVLKFPYVAELIVGVQLSACLRFLSTLYRNGVPLPNALMLSSGVLPNRLLSDAISDAAKSVKEGHALSSALLSSTYIPDAVIQFVRVGEETGKLSEMIAEASNLLASEVERRMTRLAAILVPVITLVLGALIALLIAIILDVLLTVNELAV